MNRNGQYTRSDLAGALMRKGNCYCQITPGTDGHVYVWIKKQRKDDVPVCPLTKSPAVLRSIFTDQAISIAAGWQPSSSSEEISLRWIQGDEVSRHCIISDLLEWINVYL